MASSEPFHDPGNGGLSRTSRGVRDAEVVFTRKPFKEQVMSNAKGMAAMALMLMSGAAAAQMSGDHGGMQQQPGMGNQQGSQMMGDQMNNQQMMRDMSGMMRDMNEMMTDMSRKMESHDGMDAGHRREMSRLMQEMSDGMQDMSQQMGRGAMDPKTTQQMKDRMGRMEKMLEGMDHTGH
ncbi:MAG: hypothetical protein WC809_00080 [Sinimarinibacterium sp.]